MMYFTGNDLDCLDVAVEHGSHKTVAVMSSTSLRACHWWTWWVNLLLNCWGSKGKI